MILFWTLALLLSLFVLRYAENFLSDLKRQEVTASLFQGGGNFCKGEKEIREDERRSKEGGGA